METEAGTKKKNSHNESPSRKLTASVPGKHPVVFLFLIVFVADGFESLVTVFPRLFSHMRPRLKPGQNLNIDGDFEQQRAPVTPHLSHLAWPVNNKHGASRLVWMSGHTFSLGKKLYKES